MKIKHHLMVLLLLTNVSFASKTNSPDFPINPSRCTNTNLTKVAPYLPLPPVKKFRHEENILLSILFRPMHVIHDLIVNEEDAVMIHARFNYDWVFHKDLEDEYIHAYLFADNSSQWAYLGKYKTDLNGEIFISLKQKLNPNDYLIRMVIEGDGSSVDGFVSVVHPQHQAIVFDIDGTLTLSDFEVVKDYFALSTATPYYYAAEVLDTYNQKGYELIFLTARPYWMTSLSRTWLTDVLLRDGWPLKTRNSLFSPESVAQYKANYLKQLIQEKQLIIVRAYGNAMTDIEAYALAKIPKNETYIIGPNAGKQGTKPIHDDYFNHFFEVVTPTPEANCKL